MKGLLKRILGSRHDREVKRLQPVVDEINDWFEKYQSLSEDKLKGKTEEFRERIRAHTAEITGAIEHRAGGDARLDADLPGEDAGEGGLAEAGRADQKHAFGNSATKSREFLRVTKKIYDFLQFLFCLFDPCHIIEGHLFLAIAQ